MAFSNVPRIYSHLASYAHHRGRVIKNGSKFVETSGNMPSNALEYEEEDLFGSEEETLALQSALLASGSKDKPILQECKSRATGFEGTGKGVSSLKIYTLTGM